MSQRRRLWAVLAAAYVTTIGAIQFLWNGGASFSLEAVGRAAVVLLVQCAALEIVGCAAGLWRDDTARDGVAAFLMLWIALVPAFGVSTLAFDLLVRDVNLTSVVVFSLLVVPAAQAWAVMVASGRGPAPAAGWPSLIRHPMARPLLLLDGLLLLAGLIVPNQPLVGLAAVGLVQRRWVGTKLLVAAAMLAAARGGNTPRGRPASQVALAIVLAALGVETFVPWLFGLTTRVPPPLSRQPPSIVWLEVYGTAAFLVLALTIAVRRRVGGTRQDARSLLATGAMAFFVATLALLMNGFLSLDPVFPWATLVVAAASIGATCYAGAGLLLAAGD